MLNVHRIHETIYNDTMDVRNQLIHDDKYCQVLGNKQFFVVSYPIKKKYDCHLGLDNLIKEYGAPDKMTYGGALEQIRRKTEFQRVMRKYEIKGFVTEANRSNLNVVEVYIQELPQ